MFKQTLMLIAFLILLPLVACDDDETFVRMTQMENALFSEINAYRTSNGKSTVAVNYDTMLEEAKIFSAKMAGGTEAVDVSGLAPHWDLIHEHWGGTNDVSVVSMYQKGTAGFTVDDILDPLKENPVTDSLLLSEVSIGGVGFDTDSEGNGYLTVLMMLVE